MVKARLIVQLYYISTSIAIGYLVSTITALCSGSMVLLNGTVGVGKSSIISKSAELLGGNSEIIPIRPSWLDPSDLLGFFDPLSETFRPSSFTTALKTAAKYPDRPFFICLDELNLAKIENYGADLLSTLEYSKNQVEVESNKRNLSLYSQDIERHLWEKLKLLKAEENVSIEQKLLIAQLDRTLSTMPSECEIPQNLILVGTLNSDETTYDLSPKAIDRSYVITYPPADFKAILSKGKTNISEQLSITQFREKVSKCMNCMDEGTKFLPAFIIDSTDISSRINYDWKKDWKQIIRWNDNYISQIGIPLGYRVKRDYQIFFAVSHCLGIMKDNPKRCLSYFILSKLLPRISFFKDKDRKLETLCQQWIDEIRADYLIGGESYILEELERQISDNGRRNVRYWG
jgi:RNA-directed DNA polymerase